MLDRKLGKRLKPMAKRNGTVKIYRRLAKKRYLDGKYLYAHERLYLPIPSRLHKIVEPFMGQRLKMQITAKNSSLTITLYPAKMFRHAEQTLGKTEAENRKNPSGQHPNQNFV
jgi:hypothetical protein